MNPFQLVIGKLAGRAPCGRPVFISVGGSSHPVPAMGWEMESRLPDAHLIPPRDLGPGSAEWLEVPSGSFRTLQTNLFTFSDYWLLHYWSFSLTVFTIFNVCIMSAYVYRVLAIQNWIELHPAQSTFSPMGPCMMLLINN